MAELNSASYAIPDELGTANEEELSDDLLETVVVRSAVATPQEKIIFAWMSIERTQPERKPYITGASWNVERSIRNYSKVRKSNRWNHLGDFIGHAAPPDGISISVGPGELRICGVDVSGSIECWGNNSFHRSEPPNSIVQSVTAVGTFSCGMRSYRSVV